MNWQQRLGGGRRSALDGGGYQSHALPLHPCLVSLRRPVCCWCSRLAWWKIPGFVVEAWRRHTDSSTCRWRGGAVSLYFWESTGRGGCQLVASPIILPAITADCVQQLFHSGLTFQLSWSSSFPRAFPACWQSSHYHTGTDVRFLIFLLNRWLQHIRWQTDFSEHSHKQKLVKLLLMMIQKHSCPLIQSSKQVKCPYGWPFTDPPSSRAQRSPVFRSGPARGRSSVVLRHQPIVSGSSSPPEHTEQCGCQTEQTHSQSVALSPRTQRVESETAGKLPPDIYQCLLKPWASSRLNLLAVVQHTHRRLTAFSYFLEAVFLLQTPSITPSADRPESAPWPLKGGRKWWSCF